LFNGIFKGEKKMHHPRVSKVRQNSHKCHPHTWKAKTVNTRSTSLLIHSCCTNQGCNQLFISGGRQFSSTFIGWHHCAHSTVVQRFRKRSVR